MLRTKRLTAGRTHTLESFWNATATGYFRGPAGARIKVKYGVGWASVNTQSQILDGDTYAKLTVGKAALILARMRMKVPRDTDVTYDLEPGGVGTKLPEQRF